MRLAEVRTLFDYDDWATDRVLTQAARLTPAQFIAGSGAARPGVRQILAHTLAAEVVWRTRFETGTANTRIRAEEFTDVTALRRRWANERQSMRAHLVTLTDDDLLRPFRFERRGETIDVIRWQILFQLINHGTQHRAEVATLLTEYGHSPGDLDFFLFVVSPP